MQMLCQHEFSLIYYYYYCVWTLGDDLVDDCDKRKSAVRNGVCVAELFCAFACLVLYSCGKSMVWKFTATGASE